MATMTATVAFTKVKQAAEEIKNDEPQSVGTVSIGDVIRQGDLYLVAIGQAKKGEPIADRQLAPGRTQGSRHVLEGNAKLWRAKDAASIAAKINEIVKGAVVEEDLIGPIIEIGEGCELTHPEHGNFMLPVGETFAVVYQRAFADIIRRQLD